MTRSPNRLTLMLVLSLALFAVTVQAAKKKDVEVDKTPKPPSTAPFKGVGMIVECADYLVFGRTPEQNRDLQVKNIDSGLPVCFVADEDNEVYLLVQPGSLAKERFQPTENFVGGGVKIDGIIYTRGSIKALIINEIGRTGAYTDRQTRRATNPTPTRLEDKSDPKKNPYVP